MGSYTGTHMSPPLTVGETTSKILAPDEAFAEVNNMFPTEEGSYRSITGAYPYLLGSAAEAPPDADIANHATLAYGPVYGIHHANVRDRELLLLHTGSQIWEFRGWDRAWYPIVGPASVTAAQLKWRAHADNMNDWPTQFVSTPLGVVILPTQGRALFYDGEVVAPFGFSLPPGAPSAMGPSSSRMDPEPASGEGINDQGYAHQAMWNRPGACDLSFGWPRVGTIEPLGEISMAGVTAPSSGGTADYDPNLASTVAGELQEDRWRAKMAWVDLWGNISPLSGESDEVSVDRQKSSYLDDTDAVKWAVGASARFQMAWDGLARGPIHVIGKNLYRTKGQLTSGDLTFYWLIGDAQVTQDSFATIPDRMTEFFPDNTPDSRLYIPAPDIDPTPIHRVGALAFGRYWAGNTVGNPGLVRPSLPGRFGTFGANEQIVPDPTGSQITGLHAMDQGLLAFTETSTFLVTPNDSGKGFRVATLSSTVGCVAPSSIATTRFGLTVWLGRDGFYGYDGQSVSFLMEAHRDTARQINFGRAGRANGYFNPESGQYECWVPMSSSMVPNRRFKLNVQGSWHWDDYDGSTSMVDTTVDHRGQVLGVGSRFDRTYGVWVLDRGHVVQPAKIKTGWLRSFASMYKASSRQVRLWLRETGATKIRIDIRRNYRAEIISTVYVDAYPDISTKVGRHPHGRTFTDLEQNPSFWNVSLLSSTEEVRRRRPFWATRSVDIPVCDTFQLEISSTSLMDIVALVFDEQIRDDGGSTDRRALP